MAPGIFTRLIESLNRSGSRKAETAEPETQSDTSIKDLLKCPFCTTLMYPPIYQCCNGHAICSKCKTDLRTCPTCRQSLGYIRCLALEKVAEKLDLPCKFHSFGCNYINSHQERLGHEEICWFHPYNCIYGLAACAISGDIGSLIRHLKEDHFIPVHNGSSFDQLYVHPNGIAFENVEWQLLLIKCFGHHFCLHFGAFNINNAPVYMAFLSFMGDEIESQDFSYSLEVSARGRKMTWQGVPRSIRESEEAIRADFDGLIINREVAQLHFSDDEQDVKLDVSGKIVRKQLNLHKKSASLTALPQRLE